MFDMDKLYKLMEEGWNIHIECKAKGRVYGMTFEASARKDVPEGATNEETILSFAKYKHAVGDTLEELVDSLTEQINKGSVLDK